MTAMKDITGRRFERLVTVKYTGASRWDCQCDCGAVVSVKTSNLTSGNSRSCGCKAREIWAARMKRIKTTHGMKNSSEYKSWLSMRKRCYYVDRVDYPNYGGRGITVCERWLHSFENFLADMGMKPSPKHSIDRIDVNGNYEPSNCRWATQTEQCRNKRKNVRMLHNGNERCVKDVAEEIGMPYYRLLNRIHAGWSAEDAVNKLCRNGGMNANYN